MSEPSSVEVVEEAEEAQGQAVEEVAVPTEGNNLEDHS